MLVAIFLVVAACFIFVIFLGAPYLPSLSTEINNAFTLGNITKGQTIIELGCGDGKVLRAAAEKGINSIGYEINPILFVIAWLRTRKYRALVRVKWGNYWAKQWPEADAVFVFLTQRYMNKLDKKCMQYKYKPVKLLSFAFEVSGKKKTKQLGGIYLYEYR